MKVVTVLKTGGDFDAEYVERIRHSVKKHLSYPHQFICMTDDPDLENKMGSFLLTDDWPGWWSKMEMYRLEPPFLYIDLDCIIKGPLEPLLEPALDRPFVCIKPVFQKRKGAIASGLMWVNTPVRWVYEKFKDCPEHWMEFTRKTATPSWNFGDQRCLELLGMIPDAYWQDIAPKEFAHYKTATPEQIEKASLVMFSGYPRPRDVGWAV